MGFLHKFGFTAVIYAGLAGWIIATAATVVPLCLNAPSLTDTEISGYFFDTVLSARNDGVIDGLFLPRRGLYSRRVGFDVPLP